MRTIIRVIPGQNPETLVPALENDLEKAKREEQFFQKRVDKFIEDHFKNKPDGDERKRDWLSGRLHIGMGSGESELRELGKAKGEVKRILTDIEEVKKRGVVNPIIEFVSIDSYDQKDKLKFAGYKFNKSGYWLDPVGMRAIPAWVKRIEVKPESQDKIAAELQFVKSLGDVEADNDVNRITAGLREGRVISLSEQPPKEKQPAKIPDKPKTEPPKSESKAETPKPVKVDEATTQKLDAIEKAVLEKKQADRTNLSQASDKARKHSVIIKPDDPRARRWMRDPGSMDILGIDTPPGVGKLPKPKKVKQPPLRAAKEGKMIRIKGSGLARTRPRGRLM